VICMKGYSLEIPENCASARLEGVNASYKDLAEVCGRIRNKNSAWAVSFLGKAAEGEVPVLYKRHNKNLGHRRELGGRKGRYPEKAARIVLKLLQSAMANGKVLGLGDEYTILAASATKKDIYPRMSPKGRRMRMSLQTSRVEIVLKGPEVPKGVSVTLPAKAAPKTTTPTAKATAAPKTTTTPQTTSTAKPTTPQASAKAGETTKPGESSKPSGAQRAGGAVSGVGEARGGVAGAVVSGVGETRTGGVVSGVGVKKDDSPVLGKEQKTEQPNTFKGEGRAHEHKHETEKMQEQEKKRPATPHQHGENNKR